MSITRRAAPAGLITLAAFSFGAQALAKQPPKPPNPKPGATALSIAATPNPLVFSTVTTLSGRLTGAGNAAVVIRFEADTTRPYGDSYKPTALTTTANAAGNYSLAIKPLLNTQYQAIASTSPPTRSAPRLVLVRTLVGLRVSDSTPRRGGSVRFAGSVFPAHDGQRALIQKRTSSGRFVTLARPLLVDAGSTRSTYSRRLRVFRDGAYRVKVQGDGDHVNGFSRTYTLRVH